MTMNNYNSNIDNLKKRDVYSLMLFVLYKLRDIPEYSSISELAYILDKDNLLRLCEYFGGITLTIPTIDELESIIYSLLLYQYVNIENIEYSEAIKLLGCDSESLRKVKSDYKKLLKILDSYSFNAR